MYGANTLGLGRALAAADKLAQSIVADLERAVFQKDVARLQIAMHDAVIVQIAHRLAQPLEPLAREFLRQSLGMAAQDPPRRLAVDIPHDDPLPALPSAPPPIQLNPPPR